MRLRNAMQRTDRVWITIAALALGIVGAPAAAQDTQSKKDSVTGVWSRAVPEDIWHFFARITVDLTNRNKATISARNLYLDGPPISSRDE